MTLHKRVVIIGGGAMGTGLAYHLAEEGWTDIALVEKVGVDFGLHLARGGGCVPLSSAATRSVSFTPTASSSTRSSRS